MIQDALTPMITTIDPMKDVWRPIPGFEDYEINRAGEVFSVKSDRMMNTDHAKGFWVKMSMGNKRFTRSVVKLIDLAFPEYKKESSTPTASPIIEYIKQELDIDLEYWQKARLEQWFIDAKAKK